MPTPTATAPAAIQSPALSSDTPPVGISFTCGSGAAHVLEEPRPERGGRKHLDDVGARFPRREDLGRREAARASPRRRSGGTSRSPRAGTRARRRTARRRGWRARAVSASRIVPAPSRNSLRQRRRQLLDQLESRRGTVIVTSSARTPPSRQRVDDGPQLRRAPASGCTATTPHASISAVRASTSARRSSSRPSTAVDDQHVPVHVRHEAAVDARKTTAPARSSGSPQRPAGMRSRICR